MQANKTKSSQTWLFWIGLLLASLILTVQAFGSVGSSQALSPLAAGVTKTVEPPSIPPGQTVAPLYTVTFSNPATTTLILDWITDTLPAGFVFVGMDPSSGWFEPPVDTTGPDIVWQGPITVPATSTLSLVYAVYVPNTVPPSPIPYVNTVVARADEITIGPATAGLLVGTPHLTVTKTAAPIRLLPGQPVTYTVTFVNSGELTGTLTVISDTLDPSLTFVDMLPGSDVTDPPAQVDNTLVWTGPFTLPVSNNLVLQYQVDTSTQPGWHWPCNEITALAGDGPVGPARACVEVGPEKALVYLPLVFKNLHRWAEFTIAKSVTPSEVNTEPGQVVTYTVTIANIGNIPGKLAAVVDTLPAGFTYLDMAPGSDVAADPTGATGLIRWPGPFTVAAGGQLRLIYKVSPSQTPGQYANSANVEAMFGKPPAGPASAQVTVQADILLEEDFNNGMSRWTEFLNHPRLAPGQWYWDATIGVGGSGAVVQDALAVPGKVASDALLMYLGEGAQEWTNYRAEMKMMLTGGVDGKGHILPETGDPIGFWVRGHYQDSDLEAQWVSGYYVVLVGASTRPTHMVRIAKMQEPGDCDACLKPYRMYNFNNPLQKIETEPIAGSFEHYRWYNLAVEVRDANIKVWVDGELVLDWTDPLLPYLSGTIGFKTHETKDAMFDDVLVTPLP